MAEAKIHVVIMAGGSGKRFFPLSTESKPKQFLALTGSESLLQKTFQRIAPLVEKEAIAICALSQHESLVREQLPEFGQFISEPVGKNTAPCILLSALTLLKSGARPTDVMVVLPADHAIAEEKTFRDIIQKGCDFAATESALVTFGIEPTGPHTGYGYIQAKKTERLPYGVSKFLEKPNTQDAEVLLKAGDCYWNAGIFAWRIETILAAFEKFEPEMLQKLRAALDADNLQSAYAKITPIPVDKAILERAPNVVAFPMKLSWSDLGSWNALFDYLPQAKGSIKTLEGSVTNIESSNCLVAVPSARKVSLVGVQDLVIVENGDELLILDRRSDQLVKNLRP